MPTLHIHRQSAYLIGRDRKVKVLTVSLAVCIYILLCQVCDLPVDHPSCSKQHAAFQYRLISKKKTDGSEGSK